MYWVGGAFGPFGPARELNKMPSNRLGASSTDKGTIFVFFERDLTAPSAGVHTRSTFQSLCRACRNAHGSTSQLAPGNKTRSNCTHPGPSRNQACTQRLMHTCTQRLMHTCTRLNTHSTRHMKRLMHTCTRLKTHEHMHTCTRLVH